MGKLARAIHAPRWGRFSARLLVHRASLLLALNLVLAIAVGYLLEKLITGTWDDGSWRLLWVGGIAMVLASVLWGWGYFAGARRGALLNVCVGPPEFLARRRAEAVTLAAWSAQRYPASTIMPWVLAGSAPALVQAVTDQVACAQALAPGSRSVAVLAAGLPDQLIVAGAQLQPALGQDVRLIADAIDDSTDDPCFEFRLPPAPPGSRSKSVLPAGTSTLMALLRASPSPLPPLAETDTRLLREEDVVRMGPLPESGDSHGQLTESSESYEGVLAAVAGRLAELGSPSQGAVLDVVTDGPAVLAFSSGMMAARAGWRVRSARWLEVRYSDFVGGQVDWSTDQATAVADRGRNPLRRRWWWVLFATSALRGVSLPVLTGSIAMVCEWLVAASGATPGGAGFLGRTTCQWGLAAAVVGGGAVAVWAASYWDRCMLSQPAYTVDVTTPRGTDHPTGGTLAKREIRLWRDLDPSEAATDSQVRENALTTAYADWIKARFVEILTAYPNTPSITLRLPEQGLGPTGSANAQLRDRITRGVISELGRGFRGNHPVTLACGSTKEKLVSGRSAAWVKERLADKQLPPGMRAAIAGLQRK